MSFTLLFIIVSWFPHDNYTTMRFYWLETFLLYPRPLRTERVPQLYLRCFVRGIDNHLPMNSRRDTTRNVLQSMAPKTVFCCRVVRGPKFTILVHGQKQTISAFLCQIFSYPYNPPISTALSFIIGL